MRVLCENCGATYKIPDQKLVREVNRATCRKCGFKMVIRRPALSTVPTHLVQGEQEDERTLVTSMADIERQAREQAAALETATARVPEVPAPELEKFDGHGPDAHEATESPGKWEPPTNRPLDTSDIFYRSPAAEVHEDISDHLAPEGDLNTEDEPTSMREDESGPQEEEQRTAPSQPVAPPPIPVPQHTLPSKPVSTASMPTIHGGPAVRAPAPTPTLTQATVHGAPSPVGPPPTVTPPAVTPPPVAAARPAHDPSGDLTMVLMGSMAAVGGALILAVNTGDSSGMRFLGLLVALWGAMTALLVVLTSNRGRKAASVVLSLFLATFLSVCIASIVYVALPDASGRSPLADMRDAMLTRPVEVAAADDAAVDATPEDATAEDATAEDATAEDATAEDATAEDAADDAADTVDDAIEDAADATADAAPLDALKDVVEEQPAPPPPAATTAPATAARTTTTSSSPRSTGSSTSSSGSSASTASPPATASTGRTSSGSSGSSARTSSSPSTSSAAPSATSSAPAADPEPAKMNTLPMTVVDTMIRTNSGVKRCFADEKSRAGELPPRVEVKTTVLGSGSVSSASIKGGSYAGTDLDRCLSSAFKSITFPPFDGDAVTFTYPFVLQ